MILGILSDSHGRRERTAAAVALLRRLGAQGLVHCGDVGGPGVLEALAGLPGWVVWGNTDEPGARTEESAARLGLTLGPGPLRIERSGRTVLVFHGHEAAFESLLGALEAGDPPPPGLCACDFVLHGHTHVAADVLLGPVRVINPGALHRAAAHTVATLDLLTSDVRFWQVLDDPGAGEPTEYRPRRV